MNVKRKLTALFVTMVIGGIAYILAYWLGKEDYTDGKFAIWLVLNMIATGPIVLICILLRVHIPLPITAAVALWTMLLPEVSKQQEFMAFFTGVTLLLSWVILLEDLVNQTVHDVRSIKKILESEEKKED